MGIFDMPLGRLKLNPVFYDNIVSVISCLRGNRLYDIFRRSFFKFLVSWNGYSVPIQ